MADGIIAFVGNFESDAECERRLADVGHPRTTPGLVWRSPVPGLSYLNTSTGRTRTYNGSSWVEEDASGFVGVYVGDTPSWQAALTQIGAGRGRITVSQSFSLTANVTQGALVELAFSPGVIVTVPAGRTLTVQGTLDVAPRQVFAGAGTVDLSSARIEEVYAEWWGAQGDGATDDTSVMASALASLNGQTLRLLDDKDYRITDQLEVALPVTVLSRGGRVSFDFPAAEVSENLFNVTADDVTFDGVIIDGSSMAGVHVANRRAILGDGSFINKVERLTIRDCIFRDISATGGGVIVSHAVYWDYCDDARMEGCTIDTVSGAGIIVVNSDRTRVVDNDITETGWYSVNYQSNCEVFSIERNRITGSGAGIRNFGGSVDIMSRQDGTPVKHGRIAGNYFLGYHEYGGVVRVFSSEAVDISGNVFYDCQVKTYIRIGTRGVTVPVALNNGPCRGISVRGNLMVSGQYVADGTGNVGIYADNPDYGAGGGVDPFYDLVITGNVCVSVDDVDNYFRLLAGVNGQQGGVLDVVIADNVGDGVPITTANPVPGLIGVASLVGVDVKRIKIANNSLRCKDTTPAASVYGLYLGEYVDELTIIGNHIEGFSDGVYVENLCGEFIFRSNVVQGFDSEAVVFEAGYDRTKVVGEQETCYLGSVAAGDADIELPVWTPQVDSTVLDVLMIDQAGIVVHAVNYITLSMLNKDTGGTICSAATGAGGTAFPAFTPTSFSSPDAAHSKVDADEGVSLDRVKAAGGASITRAQMVVRYLEHGA